MRTAFTFLLLTVYVSLNAQNMIVNKGNNSGVKTEHNESYAKLFPGQAIILSPNPVPKTDPVITVTVIGVNIYSYKVFTSMGQIVELENLAGRPDPTQIYLPADINEGLYYIRFETNSGNITRKFEVI